MHHNIYNYIYNHTVTLALILHYNLIYGYYAELFSMVYKSHDSKDVVLTVPL